VLVWAQIKARRFNPWLYWATIAASTTAGTTLADFADRSLGIGYPGGSLLLLACVLLSLFAWYRTLGSIDVNTVSGPRAETFYWVTITFSQTLGTALGDWVADAGLGYSGGALVFGAALAVLASSISRPASAASACSGRRSSSPGRSARRSATSSTSRSTRAGWLQPAARLGGARGGDHRADPGPAAAARAPSVFPRVILPTSSLDHGGKTRLLLPLWVQKEMGATSAVRRRRL
jgi:hypothetical protein